MWGGIIDRAGARERVFSEHCDDLYAFNVDLKRWFPIALRGPPVDSSSFSSSASAKQRRKDKKKSRMESSSKVEEEKDEEKVSTTSAANTTTTATTDDSDAKTKQRQLLLSLRPMTSGISSWAIRHRS